MKGARIAIEGVSRIYGAQRALDKLDLTITPGEWLAVICLLYTSPSPRDS